MNTNSHKDLQEILGIVSNDAVGALEILCIPTALNQKFAEEILTKSQIANGNASDLINELRSIPIWHERTKSTWVFDEDIRDYSFQRFNGNGEKFR